jgi:hypothetical protein
MGATKTSYCSLDAGREPQEALHLEVIGLPMNDGLHDSETRW